MKLKTWLPIGLALVLGVIAAKLAKDTLSSSGARGAGASVKLVVAKRPIAPGESLMAADLEVRPIAAEALPEGAHSDPSKLVGRTARADLVKGQPVLESLLAAAGTASGLQALVPPGMRAMTIEVNEFTGVGGMVTPGSRVDVLATMRDPANDEAMSRTIAQNVIVKAVGQTTKTVTQPGENNGGEPVKSVTLLVTTKQAEAIQLGGIVGRPWLVLRGNEDNGLAPTSGTTLAELRGTAAGVSSNLLAILRNVRASGPARDAFAAHVPPSPTNLADPGPPPATQPAPKSNWMPARAVHTIRATVENTVSVTPTPASMRDAGAGDILTGGAIEP